MSSKSKIEWTGKTWNCITGCDKVSAGCKYCYAESMSKRLKAMGQPRYSNGFQLTLHEDKIEMPLRWTKPWLVFVNSMSDMFHKDVPLDFLQKMFEVMNRADRHVFQCLTKRSERMMKLSSQLPWADHVWTGVSVERNDVCFRVDHLRQADVKLRFLSIEPLLGPLSDLDLTNIDWVIVGAESGPKARPMELDWVRDIRDQCIEKEIPFFFKQKIDGGKKVSLPELDGRVWKQMPENAAEA